MCSSYSYLLFISTKEHNVCQFTDIDTVYLYLTCIAIFLLVIRTAKYGKQVDLDKILCQRIKGQ